ncbi:hypothetical protein FA95DRAFT_1565112 [Auriscalpium vulgare]|uniref:Uncharacterized protein n=1 Tax=Auriscalpium vulgare TaxID=40419 RepID=A0ACB8RC61_9AGAM|nr:hypothetical protein FA95DRAFT_1565112 [Auriscalpium vulgare]
MRTPRNDFLHSWEAFDRTFSKQPASAPDSPGSASDAMEHDLEVRERPMAPEPFSTPPLLSHASTSSAEPSSLAESSLDYVWSEVRRRNERAMAKTPSKVESLEAAYPPDGLAVHRERRAGPLRPEDQLTFADSPDGRREKATFNLPGVRKEKMHVSYRVDRLVVTWKTVSITDVVEGDKVFRDKEEKTSTRIIPLPAGTKFEDIEAFKEHPGLVVSYPKYPRPPRERPRREKSLRRTAPR